MSPYRCSISLFLSIILCSACKTGQDLTSNAVNRVALNKSDTIYQFYTIKSSEKRSAVNESDYYYWFRADTILKTRNGYDGKLLHGEYKVFYPNKNIREKGLFEFGLKTGVWKSWYNNGELHVVSFWRSGKKNGDFQEFAEDGQKIKTGKYKDDKLSGYITNYSADTVKSKLLYKEGQPVQIKRIKRSSEKKQGEKLERKLIKKSPDAAQK